MSLEKQLADYGQLQEEMFGPISVDEITRPVADQGRVNGGTRPPQTRLVRGLAWAVAAFVVVLAIGGLYFAFSRDDGQVVDQTTVPTPTTVQTTVPTPSTVLEPAPSEISIARTFLHARNLYDVESATALFTSDPHVHGAFITGVDMYPALFDWLRATGWQWMVDECHMKSGDANTVCSYHVENAWSRAMGLEPVQGSIGFEIWEGGMNAVPDFNLHHTSYFGDRARPNEQLVEVWETVIDWIRANHPTDLAAMISEDGSAPVLDARSIDLWRLYTQEFVEAVE